MVANNSSRLSSLLLKQLQWEKIKSSTPYNFSIVPGNTADVGIGSVLFMNPFLNKLLCLSVGINESHD